MAVAERSRGTVERAHMAAVCEAARGGDGGRGGEGEVGVGAGEAASTGGGGRRCPPRTRVGGLRLAAIPLSPSSFPACVMGLFHNYFYCSFEYC